MHHLEHAMRRPVDLSSTDDNPLAVLDLRCALPGVATTREDWVAVEEAAVAAAEAVAAAAAAEVACEAASTAQAAVEAARAAAAKAARRARRVAADAAGIVAAAAAAQQGLPRPDRAVGLRTRTGTSGPSGGERMATYMRAAADAASSPQATEAQHVARRVVLVAEAAATAAVDAAVVVAAQLDRDVAALADRVLASPEGDGHDVVALHCATRAARVLSSADAAARAAAPAAEVGIDASTIRNLSRQGASTNTIAAALNAGGSRTARNTRWSAATVAKMLHLFTLPGEHLPVRARAGETDAQLLAVAVSARERAEQGLEEAQRLGGLGSWSWTIAANEVTWSEQAYRLYGADPATFSATYEGFLACVHPEDREHVAAAVASVFEGALGYEFDHRVRHPNGDELWLHTRGTAIRDDDGAPIRLHGTVIDKTPAKLAEQRAQQQSKDLAQLASHDSLTGLANRSLLHDRLGHALARRGQTLSVLLLDLDDFKTVNDTSGHAAGDRLLVDVAARLLRTARGGDTVARLGGDEFAVVVEQGDAWQLAERILDVLAVPVLIGGRQVVPVASIGIATADGTTDVDLLLQQADVAMYEAKAAGKGRVARFDAAMADKVRLRTDLHEGLREAVARGEIVVHYQPIMDVGAQSMSRVEALVRWQRPAGLVSPGDFLPLAEETGLILGIGQDVLLQVCEQLHDWLAADSTRSVSVNVSPLQLLAGDYADRTLDVLADACVDPHQVVLEVTETLFLNTTPILVEQLELLRRHGIRVSIDDFGTGYSSLGRLHRLPIDSIKIDKSFVDLIRTADEPLPIINSMIVMAHALHLDVTAEGVETAEQALRLVELGCDHLQGFHFARPSTADTATGLAADDALKAWRALEPSSAAER
jgi:diguanylate cyclase (GGDEF)-like protein